MENTLFLIWLGMAIAFVVAPALIIMVLIIIFDKRTKRMYEEEVRRLVESGMSELEARDLLSGPECMS